MPLEDDINALARELATFEDNDVIDSASVIAAQDRHRRQMIYALDGMDRMSGRDIVGVETHLKDKLQKLNEDTRDKLKALVEWARATGRT
jgi:hypothetical protein